VHAHKFNSIFNPAVKRTEINDHYSVFIMFYDLGQCYHKLNLAFIRQVASEHGIMDWLSKAFHGFMDGVQSPGIHDVIADYIAFHLAHFDSPRLSGAEGRIFPYLA
jgi:hypothetical protein